MPQAADVDGEINLSTCYDVTDYPVQRNYGFQIHVSVYQLNFKLNYLSVALTLFITLFKQTKDGVFTLCAMTYGIRRNWVQAVMKNIRPTVAPDVTWYIIKTSCHYQKYILSTTPISYIDIKA